MKLEIEINNLSEETFKRNFFINVFNKTFDFCVKEYSFLKNKNVYLSLALVDKEEMRRINRIYRKINSATDVLSFAEFPNKKRLSEVCGKDVVLGEVILCYNYIEKYSKNRQQAKIETARVLSHGLLHLLGLRHGKKMFHIQDAVASTIK